MIVKRYKPLKGRSFPYTIVGERKAVRMFRNEKEKKIFMKDEEKRKWQQYKKWRKKENKNCYQKFLKEFKISSPQENKISLAELLKGEFLFQFYNDRGYIWDKKTDTIELDRSLTALEREEVLETLFNELTRKECQRLAKGSRVNWEDLYQEAKIELWKARVKRKYNPKNREGASLFTFYQKIIRNRFLELLRKERKQPFFSGKILENYNDKGKVNVDAIDARLLIDKLTSKQREAIIKVYLDGFKAEEAARLLKISVESLKDRLQGAKKKLKKYPLN